MQSVDRAKSQLQLGVRGTTKALGPEVAVCIVSGWFRRELPTPQYRTCRCEVFRLCQQSAIGVMWMAMPASCAMSEPLVGP